MKPKPKLVAKSFKATLERMASNLGWVIIRIPFDVPRVWGTRGMLRVQGEINGFAFRTSLFPTGKGYHYLLVNKRMQTGANAALGDTALFHLEPDTAKRVVTVPAELQRILNEDRSFRRSEQVAEQLLSTMEAELDLPPVLKLAFARDPRAYKGWQSMSPLQRRGYLLAIFYYRSPEARDRRIATMLEAALTHADRKPRTKAASNDIADEGFL